MDGDSGCVLPERDMEATAQLEGGVGAAPWPEGNMTKGWVAGAWAKDGVRAWQGIGGLLGSRMRLALPWST